MKPAALSELRKASSTSPPGYRGIVVERNLARYREFRCLSVPRAAPLRAVESRASCPPRFEFRLEPERLSPRGDVCVTMLFARSKRSERPWYSLCHDGGSAVRIFSLV